MTEKQADESSSPDPGEERRGECRNAADREGWESIALRRVARRVAALNDPVAPRSAGQPPADYGWEDAVLRNLSRHLKDRSPR